MVKVNEKDDPSKQPAQDPLSSMSSDGSFVVLGTSPHDSVRQPPSDHTITSQPESLNAFTLMPDYQPPTNVPESLSSDLSPEEVHRKLEEVMQHNIELKELLYQNNLSWKHNYQILLTWQEELSKQQQKNNQKFAENKEFTVKLIAENKELKRKLEELKHGSSNEAQLEQDNMEQKKIILELEQRLSALSMKEKAEDFVPSKKEQELSCLVEKLTKQLETAERSKRQLIIDNERLNAQKSRMDKEMDNLKTELKQQKIGYLGVLKEKEELLSRSSHTDVTNGTPLPDTKKDEKTDFETDLKKDEKTDFAISMKSYEKQLQAISTDLEEKTERYTSLDSWLQVAADNVNQWNSNPSADPTVITNLRKEIDDLRQLLMKEQSFGYEKKINLAEAQSQFQKLFSDYQELLEEWESFHEEQKNKTKHNDDYNEVRVQGYTLKVDNLTAQLIEKEQAIVLKNKRIEELTDLLKKQENEEIPLLKAQAEVYQSDFNAEREARANLAGEKEKLADELKRLQRQNEEMMRELGKYRSGRSYVNNGWNNVPHPGTSRVNGQSQQQVSNSEDRQRIYNEEVSSRKKFVCPKCSNSFSRLDHLELHVETCLELTD